MQGGGTRPCAPRLLAGSLGTFSLPEAPVIALPARITAIAATLALPLFALGFAAADAGAQVRQAGSPVLSTELAGVRSALDKYQDPLVAVRDGFLSTVACIDFPQGGVDGDVRFKPGAMGVHFVNMGNVGPAIDPAKPQVLIYEPVGSKLRLVAAEWFLPAQLVTDGQVPTIFGRRMLGPMDGHEPIMPAALRHYDLHVWLWRENPAGLFEPTNAKVKCSKGGYSHAEKAPAHKH